MHLSVITAVGRPEYGYLSELRDSLSPLAEHMSAEWVLYVDDPNTNEHRVLEVSSASPFSVTVLKNHFFQARGAAHARNAALDASIGRWVFVADSDDTVRPDGVRALIEAAEENDVTWAAGRTADIDEHSQHIWDGPDDPYEGRISAGQYLVDTVLNNGTPFCNNSTIIDARALRDAGGWPSGFSAEDTAMMAVVTSLHDGIWVPESVTNYRKHSSSVTSAVGWTKRDRQYSEVVRYLARS